MGPGYYVRQADINFDILQRIGRGQHPQGDRLVIEGLEVSQVLKIIRLLGGQQGIFKFLPPGPVSRRRDPGRQLPLAWSWHGPLVLPLW